MTIDTRARSFEIETVDGRIHQEPAAFPAERGDLGLPPDFHLISYNTAERTLTLTPPDGEALVVEVFDGSNQSERRGGRPTIYLDQNKWVLLGQTIHTPDWVPASELDAGRELIRLAEEQQVILLLSSGHVIETARVTGSRRRIAPMMVRLSRGWLMSDPLLVRQAELSQLFRERAGVPAGPAIDVITLDLSQLYLDPISSGRLRALPEEVQLLTEYMGSAASVFALLIEDQITHSEEGYEASREWAAAYQTLAGELGSNLRARQMSRDVTRAQFIGDLGHELPQAVSASGMTPEQFETWLTEQSEDDIATLPFVGRMRDVMHFRLRNPTESWEANDLVDMMYLPCATAYADYVVAENQTRHYLQRAQRTRADGAEVMSTLTELVDHLGR